MRNREDQHRNLLLMFSLIKNLQIDMAVEKSVLEIETGMTTLLQGQLPRS